MVFDSGSQQKIEFDVIENPVAAPQVSQPLTVKPVKAQPKTARKVFGVTRKSLLGDQASVAVKTGNTLATEPDRERLQDSDADSLPIPTDEYLVSKMPSVANEVRIPYPPEAKAKKIEGKVVMELLIDASGIVREAKVLSGPGFGLNEAALDAIRGFQFHPAEVEGRPVAVRIPFTYHFLIKAD